MRICNTIPALQETIVRALPDPLKFSCAQNLLPTRRTPISGRSALQLVALFADNKKVFLLNLSSVICWQQPCRHVASARTSRSSPANSLPEQPPEYGALLYRVISRDVTIQINSLNLTAIVAKSMQCQQVRTSKSASSKSICGSMSTVTYITVFNYKASVQ